MGSDGNIDSVLCLLGQALTGAPEKSHGVVGADGPLRILNSSDFWVDFGGQGDGGDRHFVVDGLCFGEPVFGLEHASLEADVGSLLILIKAHSLNKELKLLDVATPALVLLVVLDLEADVGEADHHRGGI